MRKATCALAAAAAIYASMPAAAAPRDDLEIVARAFDETALRVRDAEPASLVKWSGPIRYAIVHEVMHAFGFRSHPQSADSTLTYNVVRLEHTPTDRLLIRTLYDSRLKPDLEPGVASRVACRILAENMHVSRWQAEPICAQRSGRVAVGKPIERVADRSP